MAASWVFPCVMAKTDDDKSLKFYGSLERQEPNYVLALGLLGSFVFHALLLYGVRFAIVRLAGNQPVEPTAVEFVEVGPEGEILPPEPPESVVAVPAKPGPVVTGPSDPEGTTIAEASPEPSSAPTPEPSRVPDPVPVVPKPQASEPVPPPLPVRPAPQPPVRAAKPQVPKAKDAPAKSPVPPAKPPVPPAKPPIPPAKPPVPPPDDPSIGSPAKSGQDLEKPPDLTKTEFGRAAKFQALNKADYECGRSLSDVACPYSDATLLEQPTDSFSSPRVLPLGTIKVSARAVFDRTSGKFKSLGEVTDNLDAEYQNDVEILVGEFLQKCRYQFIPSDSLAGDVSVEIVASLTIEVVSIPHP